jgi:pimeloyl-ACP methyl ester carboxylesterase
MIPSVRRRRIGFSRQFPTPAKQSLIVPGSRIHYLHWAREPARRGERGLLFVHGGGAHSHWWSYIEPYYTRDFRVAAIDWSGMGDSAGERTTPQSFAPRKSAP